MLTHKARVVTASGRIHEDLRPDRGDPKDGELHRLGGPIPSDLSFSQLVLLMEHPDQTLR